MTLTTGAAEHQGVGTGLHPTLHETSSRSLLDLFVGQVYRDSLCGTTQTQFVTALSL